MRDRLQAAIFEAVPVVVEHCGNHIAEDRIAFGLITRRALVDMLGRDWSEVRHLACPDSIRDQIDRRDDFR